LIPDGERGRQVRFLDRIFDQRLMHNVQAIVFNAIRPEQERNPADVRLAAERLRTAYDWLEQNLPEDGWAVGDSFTLADCSAAPSLFYADWVEVIGLERRRVAAYRARLLAHPAVARCVEDARPYRHLFPLGAPDRD
jgi:glutathione S-transferase